MPWVGKGTSSRFVRPQRQGTSAATSDSSSNPANINRSSGGNKQGYASGEIKPSIPNNPPSRVTPQPNSQGYASGDITPTTPNFPLTPLQQIQAESQKGQGISQERVEAIISQNENLETKRQIALATGNPKLLPNTPGGTYKEFTLRRQDVTPEYKRQKASTPKEVSTFTEQKNSSATGFDYINNTKISKNSDPTGFGIANDYTKKTYTPIEEINDFSKRKGHTRAAPFSDTMWQEADPARIVYKKGEKAFKGADVLASKAQTLSAYDYQRNDKFNFTAYKEFDKENNNAYDVPVKPSGFYNFLTPKNTQEASEMFALGEAGGELYKAGNVIFRKGIKATPDIVKSIGEAIKETPPLTDSNPWSFRYKGSDVKSKASLRKQSYGIREQPKAGTPRYSVADEYKNNIPSAKIFRAERNLPGKVGKQIQELRVGVDNSVTRGETDVLYKRFNGHNVKFTQVIKPSGEREVNLVPVIRQGSESGKVERLSSQFGVSKGRIKERPDLVVRVEGNRAVVSDKGGGLLLQKENIKVIKAKEIKNPSVTILENNIGQNAYQQQLNKAGVSQKEFKSVVENDRSRTIVNRGGFRPGMRDRLYSKYRTMQVAREGELADFKARLPVPSKYGTDMATINVPGGKSLIDIKGGDSLAGVPGSTGEFAALDNFGKSMGSMDKFGGADTNLGGLGRKKKYRTIIEPPDQVPTSQGGGSVLLPDNGGMINLGHGDYNIRDVQPYRPTIIPNNPFRTYNNSVIRPGINSSLSPKNNLGINGKNDLNIGMRPSIDLGQNQNQNQESGQIPGIISDVAVKQSQKEDQAIASDLSSDLVVDTSSNNNEERRVERQDDFYKDFSNDGFDQQRSRRNRYFRERIPEEKGGDFNIDLPSFDKKKSRGFNVFVRRHGKFSMINVGALSREDAKNLGEVKVGNSAAASYKIMPSKSEVVSVFKGKGNPMDFAPSKKDASIMVEKIGRRIKSIGEKNEITMKGIQAKKKSKYEWGV